MATERQPYTPPKGSWQEWAIRALVVVIVAASCVAAAAMVVLIAVPVIWIGEQIIHLWRWWAHVWGILGY